MGHDVRNTEALPTMRDELSVVNRNFNERSKDNHSYFIEGAKAVKASFSH